MVLPACETTTMQGTRSSDLHETDFAHRISRSHLISTAQQMQEAACPHRIALKKVRNRYLQSFAKRRILLETI